MDKQVQEAVELLIKRRVIDAAELVRLAQVVKALGGSASSQPVKYKLKKGKAITKEALVEFLKDHTGAEAAEHFGVSSATINNKKQAFGLTKKKKKVKGKKVGKKKKAKEK